MYGTITVQDGVNKMLEELDVDPTEGTVKKVMDLLKRTMSRKIRAVSLTYNTVDPFGNPVVATGAFFYPLDMKVKGIVEMPPIAHWTGMQAQQFMWADTVFTKNAFLHYWDILLLTLT
jgi:hypothetical protein